MTATGREFRLGENAFLYLMDPTNIGQEFRGPHTAPIALRVADVAEAREELEGRGIEFAGDSFDTGVCHMAPFQRPGRQRADAAPPLRTGGLMQVEQVDFVNVPTRDAKRSLAWYHDVLGLPLDPNNSQELRAGQVTLTFWEPGERGVRVQAGRRRLCACACPDVEAARAELEAKGVECVGSGDTGVCKMAVFHDPDGNAVILHRRYAQ